MASISALTPITGDLYRLTWTGSSDLYHVIRNGLVIMTTEDTEAVVTAEAGDVLDVIDDGEPIPQGFPPKATINFWGVAGASEYQVQEYISGAWILRATFPGGQSFYSFTTRKLEDVTTHQFRVLALDEAGNESTADQISFLFVRFPDVPSVAISFSKPNLTITAT